MRRLLFAAFAAMLLAPATAHANPPDTYGFGSRESAMAGAVSADVKGVPAGYYNPAGLVRSPGLDVMIGYFRADHFMETNGVDNDVDPVKGLVGGLVVPGKILGLPFAFGVTLHLPDDRISRVRALRQEQPRWELYDNRNQRLYLAANLAIQPVKWLQIGGGLSFMSSTRGRLDITGSANIFSPDDSQLRHEVDADLTAVRYPQAGVRVELSDDIALAAVYRGEFQLALDLNAHLQGDVSGITTALYELETHSVNNFLPQQVVLGGSWRFRKNLRANLDATWIQWSAYVAPVAKLDVNLDIPPPAGGWPATITPPTAPAAPKIEPIRMHDRIVPKLGVEWTAISRPKLEAFGRAGYELAVSPIEPQSGLTNYIDRDRHTFSIGAGVTFHDLVDELPGALALDAHLAWSELLSDTTHKDNPADLVGDYKARGRIITFGGTMTFTFDHVGLK